MEDIRIDYCIIYGQNNHPQNGSWARSLQVEWTSYPGYPSTQNRVRTISEYAASGDVWLGASLTLQRQNGIWPPTDLGGALLTVENGFPQFGYTGVASTTGSHAVRMADQEITDMDYQFYRFVDDPTVITPRVYCNTDEERCYFPNGEEAGL